MAGKTPLREAQARQLIAELLTEAEALGTIEERSAFIVNALVERGYVIAALRPGLAESFDLSGDVAGWDDWL